MVSETLREVTAGLDDGKYSIVSTLKEGRLYLAEKAGKRFILKTAEGAKGLELLKREYELSISLSHPGLAYVFTYETDSPVGPCIVQENVDGETLDRWLSRKPALRERRRVFDELLSVMAYLHQKGIVHNDLKPENILITRSGQSLKLIDFGYADDSTHLEKAIGGTRAYAAAELIAGGEVDARSDVWSIGRLMLDLFPGRYRCIVRRCLRTAPENRFPSAGALQRAWRHRALPWKIAAALAAAALVLWPLLRGPRIVTVPSEELQEAVDSLHATVDSLQYELSERDRAEAEKADALESAKSKVEAAYSRAIPAFRKALRAATTQKEAYDAWMGFVESQKKINFDIPAAAPDAVRPALRDYIIQRNNEVQATLSAELNARILELQ